MHIRSEVVVSKPRSLAWFEAVFKNKTDELPDILRQAQWIDERANPFLKVRGDIHSHTTGCLGADSSPMYLP